MNVYCKICRTAVTQSGAQQRLLEFGIFIGRCPEVHYTIHIMLPDTANFSDFTYVNGFEILRSTDQPNQTVVWFNNTRILNEDYVISDEELLNLYQRYLKLQVFL